MEEVDDELHIGVETDMDEMRDFMHWCLSNAKDELEARKGVSIVAFVRPRQDAKLTKGLDLDSNKKPMAAIPYQHEGGEDLWYAAVGGFVNEFGAEFAIMIAEAWYNEGSFDDLAEGEMPIPPSQDPNRKECISIQGISYDATGLITGQMTLMQPFEKKDGKVEYSELVTLDKGEFSSKLARATVNQDLL